MTHLEKELCEQQFVEGRNGQPPEERPQNQRRQHGKAAAQTSIRRPENSKRLHERKYNSRKWGLATTSPSIEKENHTSFLPPEKGFGGK